ncbi:MAG: calcium/sodium antiporter [Patescibacteria group bacterium]
MNFLGLDPVIFALIAIPVGFYLLSKGSDWLVDGASSVASKLGISPLVIGLTVVAFGTSMPEMVVSVSSALSGNSSIAVANAIGSNIFNVLGILGVCSLIRPIKTQSSTVWKEIPFSLAGVVVLFFLSYLSLINSSGLPGLTNAIINQTPINGSLGLASGIILLVFFVIYMYYTFGIANTSETQSEEGGEVKKHSTWASVGYILAGLVLLILGGRLTVDGAVSIAQVFGVSDRIIGLTIVAIGTSLPELITSITATRKGNDDIAMGNVVGSNIFNIFAILGISALVGNLTVGLGEAVDMLVLVFTTLLLFGFSFIFRKYQYGKVEGAAMLALYISYTAYLILSR